MLAHPLQPLHKQRDRHGGHVCVGPHVPAYAIGYGGHKASFVTGVAEQRVDHGGSGRLAVRPGNANDFQFPGWKAVYGVIYHCLS